MPMNWNEPPTHLPGEGPHDDPIYVCENCGEETSAVYDVQTAPQTMGGPAEYERWCAVCACADRGDYDPRDEPDEDTLEERRGRR